MADPITDFDKELETLMGPDGESSPEVTPAPVQIKAGGREFADTKALATSYIALQKDYTKKSQLASALEQYKSFDGHLAKHPKLREKLNAEIDTYNKSLSQPPQATEKNDVHENRLNEIDSRMEDMMFEREINDLKSKHSLNDAAMNAIIKECQDSGGIPLEKAMRIWKSDQTSDQLAAATNQQAQQAAAVGPPSSADVTPAPKEVSGQSDAEWRTSADAVLKSFGFENDV